MWRMDVYCLLLALVLEDIPDMKTINELLETKVVGEYDVIVVGSGPAGLGAALASAENGAKTLLIEQFNCLGGMTTAGMMSHWNGASVKVRELMTRAYAKPGCYVKEQKYGLGTIPHEVLKSAIFDMVEEAGVELKLYRFACGVVMDGDAIRGVICESKSGREAMLGKLIIDCTGDGDIAAKAGAEYYMGREEDGVCQPVTLMFRIGGVDYERAVFPGWFENYMDIPKGEIQALARVHLPHPAGHVLLYRTALPGEVCVNMTNVTDIDGTDADDLTEAETVCRKQMDAIVEFLREFVPGYENCYLLSSAQLMGVRETRHFKGLSTITPEDILAGRTFDDWIATNCYANFDVHNTVGPGLDEKGVQEKFVSKGPYTIPLSACVPEKIKNLLLAGRNISGDHIAHSSFRMMGICMDIGYGVGLVAAKAIKQGVSPVEVDIKEVQEVLLKEGFKAPTQH